MSCRGACGRSGGTTARAPKTNTFAPPQNHLTTQLASKDGVTARVKALGRRLAARGAALHAARADVARLQAALEQR